MCWNWSDCGDCGHRTFCTAYCYHENEDARNECDCQDCGSFDKCNGCGVDLCDDCAYRNKCKDCWKIYCPACSEEPKKHECKKIECDLDYCDECESRRGDLCSHCSRPHGLHNRMCKSCQEGLCTRCGCKWDGELTEEGLCDDCDVLERNYNETTDSKQSLDV